MSAPALLFSLTLLTSAALLFCVQPLVGRLLLPLLGGSPQVWNTCLLFFQAALLVGYGLAHLLATRLPLRRQLIAHVACISLPLLTLPFHAPELVVTSDESLPPTLWILAGLVTMIGAPLVAMSMNGPLLQRWYAHTDADDANDPYWLYAASNGGSFLGLLGYPILAEPLLGTQAQTQWWSVGYGVMVVAVCVTAFQMWRHHTAKEPQIRAESTTTRPIGVRRQLLWVAFAAVPSSLLLGVSTFLTTDLAAIPLLWVIPLAIYLLTWIATFAKRPWVSVAWTARALPILVVGWVLLYVTEATEPAWALVLFHLLTFTAAALLCHGRLAEDRPQPSQLTRFFLMTSIGGVVGGTFNALVAPLLFVDLLEYPIGVLAACLVLPNPRSLVGKDVAWIVAVLVGAGLALFGVNALGLPAGPGRTVMVFGLPVLGAWLLSEVPARFAISVAGLLILSTWVPSPTGIVVATERSFFGVQRVTVDAAGRFDQVVHGHTLHGRQWRAQAQPDPAKRCEPLAYYHPTGPLGDIVRAAGNRLGNVAMVGVGAGSMVSYAPPGSSWWIVDIDPATWLLAREHFTFVNGCVGGSGKPGQRRHDHVLADGRRAFHTLQKDRKFGLIAVDVFSSDAIPVHMLTVEAFTLYLRHLQPDGLLAFHASNRYLDVVSVLAAVAQHHGLVVRFRDDKNNTAPGAEPSRWVVMAADESALVAFQGANDWSKPTPHDRVWTDDFNDLPRLFAQGLWKAQ